MADSRPLKVYLVRDPFNAAFQPRLIETRRKEAIESHVPFGAVIRRCRDRELYALALAQAGVPIEELK